MARNAITARDDVAAVLGVVLARLAENVVLSAVDAVRGTDDEFMRDQGTSADNV